MALTLRVINQLVIKFTKKEVDVDGESAFIGACKDFKHLPCIFSIERDWV